MGSEDLETEAAATQTGASSAARNGQHVPVPDTAADREEQLLTRLLERLQQLGVGQPPRVDAQPVDAQPEEHASEHSWSSTAWRNQGWQAWPSWGGWKTMGGMRTSMTVLISHIFNFQSSMAEQNIMPTTHTR